MTTDNKFDGSIFQKQVWASHKDLANHYSASASAMGKYSFFSSDELKPKSVSKQLKNFNTSHMKSPDYPVLPLIRRFSMAEGSAI